MRRLLFWRLNKVVHTYLPAGMLQVKGSDIVAGVSLAGLLLPEAVAYSGLADLPPQAGIIGLFAGLVCYGLIGRSRFAIVSATSSSAVVLASATSSLAGTDTGLRVTFAVALVLVAGLFFLIASMARLGNVTDFISKPVLKGFTFGLAVIIIVKQWASVTGSPATHTNLFYNLGTLFATFKEWNVYSMIMAGFALLVLKVCSGFRRIPGGLVVIVLGILLSYCVDLSGFDIRLVGKMDLSPELPSIPAFNKNQWLHICELSVALCLVLYSESYGSIRTFAVKHGDMVSPDRDLFALGLSNVLSGLLHGMPVGAGFSTTSANEGAGAVSRWAGWVAMGVIWIAILLFLPAIAFIPEPVLAAIVMYAVSRTLNPAGFKPYFLWKRDRLVIFVALGGVLLLGVLDGLLIAIVISLVMLLKRFAESKISVLGRLGNGHDFVKLSDFADAKPVDGILIVRPDQPLFFANCEPVLNRIRKAVIDSDATVHSIIISLEETPDVDGSTIDSFVDFFHFISLHNKFLVVTRLKDPVYKVLSEIATPDAGWIQLSQLSVDDAVRLCI